MMTLLDQPLSPLMISKVVQDASLARLNLPAKRATFPPASTDRPPDLQKMAETVRKPPGLIFAGFN